MKLYFLLFVFYLGCNHQNKQAMIYKYISDQENISYLVFSKKQKLTSGIYIGVEYNLTNTLVYYKSSIENLKLDDDHVSFILTKFEYSNEPIDPHSLKTVPLDKHIKIPSILEFKLYFTGKIIENYIVLERSSDLYDSRVDLIKFKNLITN